MRRGRRRDRGAACHHHVRRRRASKRHHRSSTQLRPSDLHGPLTLLTLRVSRLVALVLRLAAMLLIPTPPCLVTPCGRIPPSPSWLVSCPVVCPAACAGVVAVIEVLLAPTTFVAAVPPNV